MSTVPPDFLAAMTADFDARQAHWFGANGDAELDARSLLQLSLQLRDGGLWLLAVQEILEFAYTSSAAVAFLTTP